MDLVPVPSDRHELQVVLRTRTHAAVYNRASQSLSLQTRRPLAVSPPISSRASPPVRSASNGLPSDHQVCPYCLRPFDDAADHPPGQPTAARVGEPGSQRERWQPRWQWYEGAETTADYFRLLSTASSVQGSPESSPPGTPTGFHPVSGLRSASPFPSSSQRTARTAAGVSGSARTTDPLSQSAFTDGYYERFFIEERKLGRGARGAVFLCQHVLNGNKLGWYAVKKVPVGNNAESLLTTLKEVHLMESLSHPHVIHYQHAWIETTQLSPFAPRVPTLFVLMMAANGGSLADWLLMRQGEPEEDQPGGRAGDGSGTAKRSEGHDGNGKTAAERLKAAFRRRREARRAEEAEDAIGSSSSADRSGQGSSTATATTTTTRRRGGTWWSEVPDQARAIHYLRADEILSLLQDMTSGLAFLHDRGVLHLDLKPGNVLLHWDVDSVMPRAMLSDFGSSELLQDNWQRERSGHTGTMEYMAPETFLRDPTTGRLMELTSKADIWSLGMILHLLIFFRLPYRQVDDIDLLGEEILAYRGFADPDLEPLSSDVPHDSTTYESRRRSVPVGILRLLSRMLTVDPASRPSTAEILRAINPASLSDPNNDFFRPPPSPDNSSLVPSSGGVGVGNDLDSSPRVSVGEYFGADAFDEHSAEGRTTGRRRLSVTAGPMPSSPATSAPPSPSSPSPSLSWSALTDAVTARWPRRLQLARRWARSGKARQVMSDGAAAGVLLVKVASLLWRCSPWPPADWALYAILALALVDVLRPRRSFLPRRRSWLFSIPFILLALHVVLLSQRAAFVCRVAITTPRESRDGGGGDSGGGESIWELERRGWVNEGNGIWSAPEE